MLNTKYVIPPAINGPTATPLKKNTPTIVPTTREVTIKGESFNNVIPQPPATAAKTPARSAKIPIGDLKPIYHHRNSYFAVS